MAGRSARAIGGRRAKWLVLGAWVVLIAVFGPIGLKLPDVTNDEVVVPSGSQTAQVAHLLRDRFPGGDRKPVLLVYRRPGGLTTADRARIAADLRRARDVPLVQGAVAELVSRQRDVAVTVLALEAEKVFRVTPTIEELRKLEQPDDGLEMHVTGSPALLSDFNGAVKEADVKLLLATGALVLLLLLAVYRSPILALLPLTVVGLAYSVAAGVIYLLAKGGLPVDSTSTSLLLVLMFGAGTDYCLLLVARYRGHLPDSPSADAAVVRALPDAAPAMIASAATVITAMLAMLAGILGLNRTLGPVNAIGIGIVLLASLTLLPALLAAVGTRAFWPGSPGAGESESGLWHRVGRLIARRPAHSLAALVLLLGAGCAGLAVYKEHADWFKQFRNSTDGTRGYDVLKSRFPAGTLAPTTVVVDRSSGRITPHDVALVRSRIAARPEVAAVTDVLRRSRDGTAAELALTLRGDPYAAPALQAIRDLRRTVGEVKPGVRVLYAEGAARQVDFKAAAGRDANVIAPLVLAVVLVTLVLLLRALVAPLYLLGTVILSYLATLGVSLLVFRYLFGQDVVDPEFRLIVFIFLVALGSDYNIFLMSRVREEAQRHGTREGMLRALVATGPVITSAGLILAGTFSVLMVLPIWELLEIGFAVALGVLVDTFFVRSVLVPAIAWLVGDRSWWPSRAESGAPVTHTVPEN